MIALANLSSDLVIFTKNLLKYQGQIDIIQEPMEFRSDEIFEEQMYYAERSYQEGLSQYRIAMDQQFRGSYYRDQYMRDQMSKREDESYAQYFKRYNKIKIVEDRYRPRNYEEIQEGFYGDPEGLTEFRQTYYEDSDGMAQLRTVVSSPTFSLFTKNIDSNNWISWN